jgi:hypothetical protein
MPRLEVARTATFSPEEWEAYECATMAEGRPRRARWYGSRGGREALLHMLARAGLVLTQAEQGRIAACTEIATLDRWLDNALAAKTVADVFA